MFMFQDQMDGEEQLPQQVDAVHRASKDSSTGSTRSKLESEDSSYDSDYENSESLAPSPEGKHEDVSRTVSDTLGAEFAEYVGSSGAVSEFSHPDYTNRIEFALKLGYTEKQAQVALHKLGPRPQQNELLAELIKLGACNPGKSSEGGELRSCEGSSSQQQQQLLSGSNVLVNSRKLDSYPADGYELRAIVIDGSNVAMSHGNKELFSCRGIKLCVDWFKSRGHRDITVFVPMWRKESSRPDAITKEQEILWELEKERLLVFTPSRQMGGRRMACHDDRYILKLAVETDGVIVSNDNYRDLVNENPEFKKAIEERLLMYSFVNDRFMPPDDPLGRHGPSLDSFLCAQKKELFVRACPYGKKCTYGNKCKYYHPERGNLPHKSVSEQLAENAKIQIQEVKARSSKDHLDNLRLKATMSSPFPSAASSSLEKPRAKMPLQRTKSLLPSPLDPSSASTLVTITPPPPSDPSDASSLGNRNSVWSSPLYGDGGNHLSVAKRLSDPDNKMRQQGGSSADGGSSNLHRKLQRQLTLNPVYDPRLVHIRNQLEQQGSMSEWDAKEHAPLVRHSSAGAVEPPHPPRWGSASALHQSVTRIASAPDSYHQWHHPDSMPPPHHQYVWGPMMMPPPPQPPLPPTLSPSSSTNQHKHMSFAEKRNHLFYHLSSIFPKEQVMAAMEAHPDETDAQAICAAMLNTFPTHHHR